MIQVFFRGWLPPPHTILMQKISDPKFSFYIINICDCVSPQNSRLASASTAEASSRTKLQALNRFTAYKKQIFTRPEAVFLPQTETIRLLLSCQHQFVSSVSKLPGPTFDPQPPPSHDANLKRERAKNGSRNVLQSERSTQIRSYRDFGVSVKRRNKKAQKAAESYLNFGDATRAHSHGTTAQRRHISINNKVNFTQQCKKTRIHSELIFSIFWKTSWTVGL